MNTFIKNLPDLCDLRRLKGEITKLTDREIQFSGENRSEYHRHLVGMRNLYRLLRSEILDNRNKTTSPYEAINNDLLRKNWSKIKTSIVVAETYYE